jgi:hypothetical protein
MIVKPHVLVLHDDPGMYWFVAICVVIMGIVMQAEFRQQHAEMQKGGEDDGYSDRSLVGRGADERG